MRSVILSVLFTLGLAVGAAAQEPTNESATAQLRAEIRELRQAMLDQQKAFDERMKAMQSQLEALQAGRAATPIPDAAEAEPAAGGSAAAGPTTDAERRKLEAEFAAALAGTEPAAPVAATAAPAAAPAGQPSVRLIDIAFDLLTAGGASSAREDDLRRLDAGGHDPKNRGFTVQNAELTLAGVVDPYFRGDAAIVLQIDPEGETTIELEEAYLTTLSLPANLQVKAGQFFTAFGRLNSQHPHSWDFVDQPVVHSRFMGPDNLRNPGAQVSWLMPLPFFAELTGAIQNAQGETAPSFRSVEGEEVAGRTLIDRDVRSLDDLLYTARLKTSFDVTDEIEIVPGISAAFGPNASGTDTDTQIFGLDLYAKWKPLDADKGWPFVSWQTEAMWRRYDAERIRVDLDGDGVNDTEAVARRTLDDWGAYTQVMWGFARPWTAGVRYDWAAGEHADYDLAEFGLDQSYRTSLDPFRDRRQRVSVDLTWYPSEFSKLRLQYNWDHADFLDEDGGDDDAHGVFLQAEILFGAHGAHRF